MNLILVAVDGSESGDRAVLRAADAAKERSANVLVLHVLPTTFEREKVAAIEPAESGVDEAFAREVVDRALTLLAERGIRAEGKILEGAPAQVILKEVEAVQPALVVLGSRGRQDLVPEGSVSTRVRARSGVEVEIVE